MYMMRLSYVFGALICHSLWSKHFGELLILQTSLEEFFLGQLTIVVLVHFGKDVFGSLFS